ncbi:hypothetical protein [Nocardiopsis sp. NPDC006938]|uniref:hypothetical protein n=1 Tax=Nocardiopsis sp. NPDC006938 TaxID=3364337 RepID=UPI003687CF13
MNRALSILTCVVLVVLIAVLQRFVVSDEDMTGPITTKGDAGTTVDADDFTVRVTETELVSSLEVPDEAGAVQANGVWVVVWADVTAAHEPIGNLRSELLMKDGTTYVERGWFSESLDRQVLSPGLTLHGAFVFEVPSERIEEPALVITNAQGYDSRLGAQARVDLGVDHPTPASGPATLVPARLQAGDGADGKDDHATP